MKMQEYDLAELLRKRQETFIETRAKIEAEVNNFLSSLETVDEDIKTQIELKSGETAKDWLPELWNEPFNIDTYNVQLSALYDFIEKVHTVCDRINQEALRCLTQ